MKHQFHIGKYYLCIADHPLKSRSGQNRNKAERRLKQLQAAKMMAQTNAFECELCGEQKESLQMHHLLAASIYPEKALEPRNTMLVCSTCHQRIHNDPFLWCDLIKRKMPETAEKVDAIVGNPPYKNARTKPGAQIESEESAMPKIKFFPID